ncbi:unnamed protein product [Discula destructiva]
MGMVITNVLSDTSSPSTGFVDDSSDSNTSSQLELYSPSRYGK